MSFEQVNLTINKTATLLENKVTEILKNENLSLSQKIEKLECIVKKYGELTEIIDEFIEEVEEEEEEEE